MDVEAASDVSHFRSACYVPTVLTLWMMKVGAVSFYKLDRKEHEENLRKLAARS
jgi:hypothetical protein